MGRRHLVDHSKSIGGDNNRHGVGRSHDLESGSSGARNPLRQKFRDVVGRVIEDGRRQKMKEILLKGVDDSALESYRKSDEELKSMKNKKARQFYEAQNDRLNDWLEIDSLVRALADDVFDSFDPQDRDGDGIPDGGVLQGVDNRIEPFLPQGELDRRRRNEKYARWAININVLANIALLAAKVFAALYSSSLSLIASLVDSALDLLCTAIVWTTSKLVAWKIRPLSKRFPIGRRRLEPIGILVFSVIMVVSFIQVLQESVKKLMPGSPHTTAELPPTAVFAMLATVLVKGVIWIGCARVKTTQVQALAQDCKTDVFFNTLSLAFPFIGNKFNIWWLDPVGAALLSVYIIVDWARTCLENVARLTGVGVDDRTLTKLMYLCWRFSPVVDAYKSVTAYHAGDGIWCEVDLLMDEKTPLEHTHDIAETLQYCLEGLEQVDRAFVSVDYTSYGPKGHAFAG